MIIDTFTDRMNSGAASTLRRRTRRQAPRRRRSCMPCSADRLAFQEPLRQQHHQREHRGELVGEPTARHPSIELRLRHARKPGHRRRRHPEQESSTSTPRRLDGVPQDFSLAAGFADKVTQSTMAVNGFNLQCVDFNAPGVPGTEHDLHDGPGHPRLCQGRHGLDDLRDQALPPHRRRRCSSYHRAPRSRPPHPFGNDEVAHHLARLTCSATVEVRDIPQGPGIARRMAIYHADACGLVDPVGHRGDRRSPRRAADQPSPRPYRRHDPGDRALPGGAPGGGTQAASGVARLASWPARAAEASAF